MRKIIKWVARKEVGITSFVYQKLFGPKVRNFRNFGQLRKTSIEIHVSKLKNVAYSEKYSFFVNFQSNFGVLREFFDGFHTRSHTYNWWMWILKCGSQYIEIQNFQVENSMFALSKSDTDWHMTLSIILETLNKKCTLYDGMNTKSTMSLLYSS